MRQTNTQPQGKKGGQGKGGKGSENERVNEGRKWEERIKKRPNRYILLSLLLPPYLED